MRLQTCLPSERKYLEDMVPDLVQLLWTKLEKIQNVFWSKWSKQKIPNIPLAFDGECKADFWLLQCGIAPNLIL